MPRPRLTLTLHRSHLEAIFETNEALVIHVQAYMDDQRAKYVATNAACAQRRTHGQRTSIWGGSRGVPMWAGGMPNSWQGALSKLREAKQNRGSFIFAEGKNLISRVKDDLSEHRSFGGRRRTTDESGSGRTSGRRRTTDESGSGRFGGRHRASSPGSSAMSSPNVSPGPSRKAGSSTADISTRGRPTAFHGSRSVVGSTGTRPGSSLSPGVASV